MTGVIDQLTLVLEALATVAVNCFISPPNTDGVRGVNETEGTSTVMTEFLLTLFNVATIVRLELAFAAAS
jgi:hypothetical protein